MKTVYDLDKDLRGAILHTNGKGLWSGEKRATKVKRIDVEDSSDSYGKHHYMVNVYLYRGTWNTDKHGLVYTDKLWIKELRDVMVDAGFKHLKKIDYTEQGMQGDDYVSLEVHIK
jgi:hypothetical protein